MIKALKFILVDSFHQHVSLKKGLVDSLLHLLLARKIDKIYILLHDAVYDE